jgi:hypothetical protein
MGRCFQRFFMTWRTFTQLGRSRDASAGAILARGAMKGPAARGSAQKRRAEAWLASALRSVDRAQRSGPTSRSDLRVQLFSRPLDRW